MDALWLRIAQVLAVYQIDPVPGAPAQAAFTSGGISHPVGFKWAVRIRSKNANAR
ncbi:hypothetical protein FA95DRAFT_1605240 [Auriscalpium vulgare]|uniref:Uncharacterized protein n=1 Tax=Auriscalpium vulgare TaxID=40419 RepID=A0ACB8RWD1_9AGAM|nr:hypothetical protein FA95DRAFT_1605240 [Auriscalpium vulgare]